MIIDCDACAVRGPACSDCVVSVLLGGPPVEGDVPARADGSATVELDRAERAALAVLAGCGLVPPLRLVPMDGPVDGPVEGPAGRRTDRREDRRVGRPEPHGDTAEREVS